MFFMFQKENQFLICLVTPVVFSLHSSHEQIVYAERPLTDNNRSLASYGLKDGDVVILRQKDTVEPRPSIRFPGEK